MDIISGLSTVKIAIDIAKDLRSIDRSLDEATYKLKLADLTSALADTQIALADAKMIIGDLESRLKDLSEGTSCPVCRNGRLKVTKVENHDYSNFQFHTVTCDSSGCDFAAIKTYDPTRGLYA